MYLLITSRLFPWEKDSENINEYEDKRHIGICKRPICLLYYEEYLQEQDYYRLEELIMENLKTGLASLKSIEGLDVEQGILYCNGEEAYIEILRSYCEEWKSSEVQVNDLFEKKDWKNYTIAVHGLKSSLFSIGVNKISEMAKQLEFAGKENRIEYIEANHSKLIEAYEAFFTKLSENESLCLPKVMTDIDADAEVISGEKFEQFLSEMEVAAYSFDIDSLVNRMNELEKYCFKGKGLKNVLAPIRRKIEMCDYISAVETLIIMKKEMDET